MSLCKALTYISVQCPVHVFRMNPQGFSLVKKKQKNFKLLFDVIRRNLN